MAESELIASGSFTLLILAIGVGDVRPSTSPFAQIFGISIADLHVVVVETAAFGEPLDYEASLALDPLNVEVKPP